MPSPRRVLGIDPGTRVTGFAVIETMPSVAKPKVLDVGVIRLPRRGTHASRLVNLHDAVKELVRANSPDLGVIEKAFFGINASSSLKLGEARGAIRSAIASCGVPIHEVSPTEVKKFIAGRGHATKQQLATAITNLFQIDLKSSLFDASDALALAFCHHLVAPSLNNYGGCAPQTSIEKGG